MINGYFIEQMMDLIFLGTNLILARKNLMLCINKMKNSLKSLINLEKFAKCNKILISLTNYV